MEELKPCPFCGSEGKPRRVFQDWWKVRCTNKECGGNIRRFKTKEEALAAWNRRSERDD